MNEILNTSVDNQLASTFVRCYVSKHDDIHPCLLAVLVVGVFWNHVRSMICSQHAASCVCTLHRHAQSKQYCVLVYWYNYSLEHDGQGGIWPFLKLLKFKFNHQISSLTLRYGRGYGYSRYFITWMLLSNLFLETKFKYSFIVYYWNWSLLKSTIFYG